MAKEEPTPFTRECARTGEEFVGKGYIVQTTEGTEIWSAEAFERPWSTPAPARKTTAKKAAASDQAPADPASTDQSKTPADPSA